MIFGLVLAVAVLWWQQRAPEPVAPSAGKTAPHQAPRRPAGPAPTAAQRPYEPSAQRPREATHERPAEAPPVTPRPQREHVPAPQTQSQLKLQAIRDRDEQTAVATVAAAIDAGGPFAYRKDGTVWENREQRLPRTPRGYYREYTVPTPGEDDRGARRIVAGSDGELYYTRDHYRSFQLLRDKLR